MNVTFLGVGEAFSDSPSVSFLLDEDVLVECGPQTVMQLMKMSFDPSSIDIVYISHAHADHYFGIPLLLQVLSEEGREKPLEIIGPEGIKKKIEDLLYLGYRKNIKDLGYKINIKEESDGSEVKINKYKFSFAETIHSVRCLSVSISKGGKKVSYTGDGRPTTKTKELVRNSDMLIAESYCSGFRTHSSIVESSKLARESNSKLLVAVHIYRKCNLKRELEKAQKIFSPIIIPKEFDTIKL